MRYKSQLDLAEGKHKEAVTALNGRRAKISKLQQLAKHTQKSVSVTTALLKKKRAESAPKPKGKTTKLTEAQESEEAAARVNDVIASFQLVAERRRKQLNEKRSSSASSTWVQSLPGLSGPLKVRSEALTPDTLSLIHWVDSTISLTLL